MRYALAITCLALMAAACTDPSVPARRIEGEPVLAAPRNAEPPRVPEISRSPMPALTPAPALEIRYRLEVRVDDADDFPDFLQRAMSDQRGWVRAGFDIRPDPRGPYLVVLAEGAEVDELCRPYDTGGQYSCQNGPVVALNADRWRRAVDGWPATLNEYRLYLVNHEMGHLLGQRHVPCPGAGQPAPVMFQQSSALRGCRPNGWPTETDIERAARHDQKIAPGPGE